MAKKKKEWNYLDEYFDESGYLNRIIPSKEDLQEEYEDLKDEIAYCQYQLYKTDRKAFKKNQKKRKKGEPVFLTSKKQMKKRKKILKRLDKGGILDRIIKYLSERAPFFKSLGKMVAKFICAFLNLKSIKENISEKWLSRFDVIYTFCVNL